MYPVYNDTSIRRDSPYLDLNIPIHIISGAAGCRENLDGFVRKKNNWSYIQVSQYGYGILSVIENKLHWIQKGLQENDMNIVDEFWLLKS
mgnify:FL=1